MPYLYNFIFFTIKLLFIIIFAQRPIVDMSGAMSTQLQELDSTQRHNTLNYDINHET
jgi:hypothetical protein